MPHNNLIENNNNQLLAQAAVVISSSSSPSLSASSRMVNSNLISTPHENFITWQPNISFCPTTSPQQLNQHFSFLSENKNVIL